MFLLIASVLCQVEPVGRWFEAFIKRRNINVSASFQELEDEKELSEESGDEELQLEEYPMLKTLDPKDWKVFSQYGLLLTGFAHQGYLPCSGGKDLLPLPLLHSSGSVHVYHNIWCVKANTSGQDLSFELWLFILLPERMKRLFSL